MGNLVSNIARPLEASTGGAIVNIIINAFGVTEEEEGRKLGEERRVRGKKGGRKERKRKEIGRGEWRKGGKEERKEGSQEEGREEARRVIGKQGVKGGRRERKKWEKKK